ncbi:MAG: hypothetical protein R3C51_01965 [Parvularculaceae bacterium]
MATQTVKPPIWFFIASGLGLIWNLLGVFAYIQQVTISPEALAAMPEMQRALIDNLPIWVIAAYAIAVFGGAAGCVLLLMGRKLAKTAFWVSLAGILAQNTYTFLLSDAMTALGAQAVVLPVLVLAFALALLWLSIIATARGWLV